MCVNRKQIVKCYGRKVYSVCVSLVSSLTIYNSVKHSGDLAKTLIKVFPNNMIKKKRYYISTISTIVIEYKHDF